MSTADLGSPFGIGRRGILSAFLDDPSPPITNGLMGLARNYPPLVNALNIPPPTPLPSLPCTPPVRRKMFFSFHYREDIKRASVVRNSWRIRPKNRLPTSNFIDKSLWEGSQRQDESLKRLIRDGMSGSTVTCILAGTLTWSRPWVRYEIAHSLRIRNGLFVAYIDQLRDPSFGTTEPGPNPLDFMGLQLRPDGRGSMCELVGGQWRIYEPMRAPVPWPKWLDKPEVGYLHPLSRGAPAYDYVLDDGYNNLCHWARASVRATGRT